MSTTQEITNLSPSPAASQATVLLLGRPNVGKSSIFNKLIGERRALVFDRPGVTRDCLGGYCREITPKLWLVDSGGVRLEDTCPIGAGSREHLQRILLHSALVLLVVDGRAGLTAEDQKIATWLRRFGKPVVLVINKIDGAQQAYSWSEFASLGFERAFCVSAEHKLGLEELQTYLQSVATDAASQAADEHVPGVVAQSACAQAASNIPSYKQAKMSIVHDAADADEDADEVVSSEAQPAKPLTLAVIGRPNVGKSSLINCMLGREQHLASPIAGTTIDACDSLLTYQQQQYVLVDTAGIRRPNKITDRLERLVIGRSFAAMDRAQVVLLILDGTEQPTEQDMRLAMMAVEKGKGLLLVINKWDLPDNELWRTNYAAAVYHTMPFAHFAPIVHVSAKLGHGLNDLFAKVEQIRAATEFRIGTGELNRWMQTVVTRHPPAMRGGRRPKLLYVTQPHVCPPTIVFKGNREQRLTIAYRRYLENTLREKYPLLGTPIWFKFRVNGSGKSTESAST